MIDHLDYLVLTTSRESDFVDLYTGVLGMQLESFVGGMPPVERKARSLSPRHTCRFPARWIFVLSPPSLWTTQSSESTHITGPSSKGRSCAPVQRKKSALSTCVIRTSI
jgi:hypothetical protein